MYGYYNKQTYFHGTTYENFFEEKKSKRSPIQVLTLDFVA